MNLILFLLLALTACRTGLVQCEDDKDETGADIVQEDEFVVATTETSEGEENPEKSDVEGSGDGENQGSTPNSDPVNNEEIETTTKSDTDTDDLNSVIMIIIPLVLTLVIIAVIVCVVMIYRRGRIRDADTKEDPYLDHEDHEKVPMPMFEDDIPSVMELEMEDLENWISKDGGKKVDTGQI
ncbi:transmembrane protein 154 [Rhinichthys klamathensis goyatoka]|uniref:transmembrane protein 154 n=1 Tax=Rhinichthys klamathensis goyatoka TaxID=3034132 RepID=UPI0024B5E2C1|nr:transmembrane protein 154 [Rhinichthys klamathensis goyatoka]